MTASCAREGRLAKLRDRGTRTTRDTHANKLYAESVNLARQQAGIALTPISALLSDAYVSDLGGSHVRARTYFASDMIDLERWAEREETRAAADRVLGSAVLDDEG
jgi:hypothetical protein